MNNSTASGGIDLGIIVVVLVAIVIVLIVAVILLYRQQRDLKERYDSFMQGAGGKSLERVIEMHLREMDRIIHAQNTVNSRLTFLEAAKKRSLTKYGIVKYDAFDDVGGKLSFALALLDNYDTGFVLNVIHSKDSCYMYLKEILKGESYIMLSKEEVSALRLAKKYGVDEDSINRYNIKKALKEQREARKTAAQAAARKPKPKVEPAKRDVSENAEPQAQPKKKQARLSQGTAAPRANRPVKRAEAGTKPRRSPIKLVAGELNPVYEDSEPASAAGEYESESAARQAISEALKNQETQVWKNGD